LSCYLGINVSHNASAALMSNGKIIVAIQEERITQKKNFTGYPKKAIQFCINEAKKRKIKIEKAAFSTIKNPPFSYRVPLNHFFSLEDYDDFYGEKFYKKKIKGISTEKYISKLLNDKRNNLDLYLDFKKLSKKDLFNNFDKFRDLLEQTLRRQLNPSTQIIFLDHHSCHAYYAYYAAIKKNNNCAVVTLDSMGDDLNQTVWIPEKEFGGLKKVSSSSECELARVYKFVTLILSMKPDEHEYKVMGLAPYAKESYCLDIYNQVFKNLVKVKDCKIIHNKRPKDLYGYLKNSLKKYRFDNIAGAAQIFIEKKSAELLNQINKKYKIRNFAISGGVSMNIKMNKVLSNLKFVNQLYVPPSGSDESLSMGACYYLSKNKSKSLKNIYLGHDIGYLKFQDIKKIFSSVEFKVKNNCTHDQIAKLLKVGEIIAVARGREEFGARALGNRSIIANPSIENIVQKINETIKNRDFWMPFALTILKEDHSNFIKNPNKIRSDFMTIGFDTIEKNLKKIKSATHPYDKSVRPQILEKNFNKNYYSIIQKFKKITKIPGVLNTSLNLHGFPICSNIKDIKNTFAKSDLKYLYINDKFLIQKK
jgi:carbamoyltransferase